MYQCQACRSAFLDPRPTARTIHLAYQTYYTHNSQPRKKTEELGNVRRAMRALANGYRNRRFGANLKPASRLGEIIIPAIPAFRESLDRELRYLPPLKTGAQLLDVGFGNGVFLRQARQIGWNVAGVDPDLTVVENARKEGLDVRQGDDDAFADHAGRFDAITFSHVIEHVHDPVKTLQEAFRLLKPGGFLYLDTPDIDAVSHKEFGEHWRGLEVPRHLTIFSWPSLQKLLMKTGFKEISRQCRTDVYAGLAAASRSMRDGKDPRRDKKVTIRDRLKGVLVAMKVRMDFRQGEFITLVAYKPKQ